MKTPIAILGGGPCGLAFALMLAQRGIRSVVFEKKAGLSTHPKAMGISRRTAEIFQQLGLFDSLWEKCRHLSTGDDLSLAIWAKSLVGEELGRVPLTEPLSPLSPGPTFHCPQTLTEQTLFDALEAIAPGTVRFGHDAQLETVDADGVTLRVNGTEEWRADWLIAADGASSGMRHQLGIECDGPGDMGHFINTFFRADYGDYLKDRRALLYSALSSEFFEFFVAVNGTDQWLMHHFLQPGESIADYSAERLRPLIQQASGRPDIPVEVISLSPWVMSPKVAREFRRGRILLIGDAAARLSPAGGLGLNTGLQSAHNLAWKLAAVVNGTASPALLDTYPQERHGAALWVLAHTNKNSEEIFAIVQAAMADDWDKVRDLIAHNRRAGSNLGIDLGIEYPAGAFIPDGTPAIPRTDPANDYVPNARPGSRAPHFLLADGRSILSTLGKGWMLLSAGSAFSGLPAQLESRVITESAFAPLYGLKAGGAVLIRPDGYIAARWPDAPTADEVIAAQQRLLAHE